MNLVDSFKSAVKQQCFCFPLSQPCFPNPSLIDLNLVLIIVPPKQALLPLYLALLHAIRIFLP